MYNQHFILLIDHDNHVQVGQQYGPFIAGPHHVDDGQQNPLSQYSVLAGQFSAPCGRANPP